jgi:hypothetical protein
MASAQATYDKGLLDMVNGMASKQLSNGATYGDTVNNLLSTYFKDFKTSGLSFEDKLSYLAQNATKTNGNWPTIHEMNADVGAAKIDYMVEHDHILSDAAQQNTANTATATGGFSTVLFIVGGAALLYSAIMLSTTAILYYHPSYDDIPLSMVDMRETQYGDRYVKYEVVREAEAKKNGDYAAGDLNAFEAQRWNALYYTKSYEAGKPLLADEFVHSTSNNKAKDGYTPIHRFGEEICYDLNKYNFSDKSPSIYLSVKQSKNDKSAVADVPEVVGSIFSGGLWMLFGGVGALFGVGGTLGTQALLKKKREKKEA